VKYYTEQYKTPRYIIEMGCRYFPIKHKYCKRYRC